MAENGCGMQARADGIPDIERAALIREAFRLEWFTIAWMTGEAITAIASGIAAHSISLTAFGVDSLIELASAGVLIWRLSVELKLGRAFSEDAERIAGGLLFALAAYVVAVAGWGLWHCEGEGFSWPGLIVTLLAIPVVYLLAQRKLAVAVQLGSGTLRADAVESIACGWLSFAVALGLLAQLVIGAWWMIP
jgi:divalent metal cation (Fe/Co/Zn/Cd) transporter